MSLRETWQSVVGMGSLAGRAGRLWLRQPQRTEELVSRSYDSVAAGYDRAWTAHMRDITLSMLDRLDPPAGAACIDLACGTGFLTRRLAERTGTRAVGVDASGGMLAAAGAAHGEACEFVQADALDYLRGRASQSADVVTCAWALGYTRPVAVVRQAARVLRRGGRLGIVDNSLFSLAEVLWAAARTFAERPAALCHVVRFRFLPTAGVLAAVLRACGLRVPWLASGSRTYLCPTGRAVIERLTATGAAAGFEFAAAEEHREAVFARFAEVMEQRYGTAEGVPFTHRHLAAVGARP